MRRPEVGTGVPFAMRRRCCAPTHARVASVPCAQDLSIWQPMDCQEVPELYRPHLYRLPDLLDELAPALAEQAAPLANLLPAGWREALGAASFTARPMQLHAVRMPGGSACLPGTRVAQSVLQTTPASPLLLFPRGMRTEQQSALLSLASISLLNRPSCLCLRHALPQPKSLTAPHVAA